MTTRGHGQYLSVQAVTVTDEIGREVDALEAVVDGWLTHITVDLITPEMAVEWLACNRNPRRMRPTVTHRYAQDMAKANWAFPVDFIAFDVDGNLVQGQHRLAGCVESDASFVSMVARNVSTQAIEAMDRGLKRTLADSLRGRGYDHANTLQSGITLSWRWEKGLLSNTKIYPTDIEVFDWLNASPTMIEAARLADGVRFPRSSVSAALFNRALMIDEDATFDFASRLASGAGLAEDDPVLKLREVAMSGNRKRSSDAQVMELALAIKTWNAWITGKSVKFLRWMRGGNNREPFPVMVHANGRPFKIEGVRAAQEGEED